MVAVAGRLKKDNWSYNHEKERRKGFWNISGIAVIIDVIKSVSLCGIKENFWYSRHCPFIFNSDLPDFKSVPSRKVVISSFVGPECFPGCLITCFLKTP